VADRAASVLVVDAGPDRARLFSPVILFLVLAPSAAARLDGETSSPMPTAWAARSRATYAARPRLEFLGELRQRVDRTMTMSSVKPVGARRA
jgi:hypothetical protein